MFPHVSTHPEGDLGHPVSTTQQPPARQVAWSSQQRPQLLIWQTPVSLDAPRNPWARGPWGPRGPSHPTGGNGGQEICPKWWTNNTSSLMIGETSCIMIHSINMKPYEAELMNLVRNHTWHMSMHRDLANHQSKVSGLTLSNNSPDNVEPIVQNTHSNRLHSWYSWLQ